VPESPFRDRVYSVAEARRLLLRAARLADADGADGAMPVARAELERMAASLGIPAETLARAASSDADGSVHRRITELPHFLEYEELYEGTIDPAGAALAETITAVLGPGRVEVAGDVLTWKTEDTAAVLPRTVTVALRREGGGTQVRVLEMLWPSAVVERPLFALVAGMFCGIALTALVGLEQRALSMGMTWAAIVGFAIALVGRFAMRGIARTRASQLRGLMARIGERSVQPEPRRAAAPSRLRVAEDVAEAEGEAEEECDAPVRPKQRA